MEDDASATGNGEKLISSFCEITSSTREEAKFFLEGHQWDLDAAVSTFLDNDAAAEPPNPNDHQLLPHAPARSSNPKNNASGSSPSPSQSTEYSPSESSPSRSRSPSPPSRASYRLRSRRAADKQKAENPSGSRTTRSRHRGGNIRTFADLNRPARDGGDESDSDEAQEYYTGGEKSGMLVQDPRKAKDVDAIFDQARQSAVERPVESSRSTFRSFTGTGRLLSGESVSSSPQQQDQPQEITHTITFWRNGFTVDDGPLRRMDDPANASFLESVSNSECPQELEPADRRVRVCVDLIRREENFTEPPKRQAPFQGIGRTIGASTSLASNASEPLATSTVALNSAPPPSMGLVVDTSLPTTSIQLRLADGTRLVSRFNNHHTIRDIRAFIDSSRPGGTKDYQLLTMGFPPKQLADMDQTIEQAGVANSVVIQKF